MTRVLVVGSDALGGLVDGLDSPDVDVAHVEGAAAALLRLERRPWDCVVAAADLPAMDGAQFLARARRERPDAETVLLVDGDSSSLDRAHAAGVDDVVPFDADAADAVVSRVDRLLAERRVDASVDRARRLRDVVHEVTRELVAPDSRDAVERAVCDALVESGLYGVAWTSAPDGDHLVPRYAAGIDCDHLDRTPAPDDGPVVVSAGDDGPHASATVRLAGRTDHGGLHVAATGRAFDAAERDHLADLGDAVSDALDAATGEDAAADGDTADDVDASVEAFTSVLSHELRNHLQVGSTYLELARDRGGEEDFDRVSSALDRIERLADDVATLTRRELDRERVTDVDVGAAAVRVWEGVKTRESELDVRDTVTVRGEEPSVDLLLENLLRNSVQHAGTDVSVRVGALDDGDGFYVADDGPGIPDDDREKVFESRYSTREDGVGLGLAIVHRIAALHGWRVRVDDADGGGARFEIVSEV